MPATVELVGRVGRIAAAQPPNEHGLIFTFKLVPASGSQRVTACALTADVLGLVTERGQVYAVHTTKQRFTCLDTLGTACTAASFMSRLSRRLFVGCSDGSIHCYDITNSARLAQLPGHRTAVVSLSTKSDTEQLLSASADAVLLWDMATFRQRRMLGSAPYGSSQAAFSPAGNLIAAASTAGHITLWDAKSLRELGRLQTPFGQQKRRFAISSISISPDEQWLLVGCKAPALLLLYNLQALALQHALQLPREMCGVQQVQMLPDSCSAAVLTSDGCISLMDVHACSFSGQLQLTFPGCRALSFSTDPRANSMAVVCSDGLLRLYDLGMVRGRQQGLWLSPQLVKLQQSQLQQLPTSDEPLLLSTAAPGQASSSIARASQTQQQQHSPKVLSEVGNVPTGRPASTAKGARPSRNSGSSTSNKTKVATGPLHARRLDGPAAALNRRKLQEMLLAFGEFPAHYRRLIWEHLLQLPHNSEAFSLLQDRGLHTAFKDLTQQLQLPGTSRSSSAVRLQACLSQLAHWCPLFGEAGFLPRFAFPFVKLFGPKAEAAFEALATLLLNWCKGWFDYFPNPPPQLLRRFLLLVSHHDLELGSHLQHLGLPVLEQLWQHMSGAMSDLLPEANHWLVLWDHCLAADSGPGFFYQVLCSYLISQRQLLLAVHDEQQLVRLFDARPPVDILKVIKRAHLLQQSTPDYAQLGLSSLVPLPVADNYPVFSEYPVGSVEQQQLERQRIQEAEEALIRRRQVVAELQQRSKQVAFEASALTSQRQQLAALDAQRRAALRDIEDSLATAEARLDDRAKQEKLKQIRLAEEAYQASLSSLRAEWSAELAALKADVEHKRHLAAATLKARQEEEDIKALEFQAQQRLWALQQEELAAAGTSALRDAAASQAQVLASELQRKAAEWQAEDEARTLKQQHELARKARLAAAAEQEAAKQAASGLLLTQELQAHEELAKVEAARRLRQLAEDEADLTALQAQLLAERQAVAAAAARQAVQEQAQTQRARFEQQQQERMAAVAAEREAMQRQLSELHLAAADVGSAARLTEVEQQLRTLEAALKQADQEHAARVQTILTRLQVQQPAVRQPSTSAGLADSSPAAAAAVGQPPLDMPGAGGQSQPPAAVPEAVAITAAHAAGAGAEAAAAGQASRDGHLAASLEAVEQQLAALRRRRAAMESLYGPQVDEEMKQLLASRQQARGTASMAGAAAAGGSPSGSASGRQPQPTSEASAGSGSSGDTSTAATSMNVSAELEQLLADAEAEVQHELAMARQHLLGSQQYPHSSATPPLQQVYPSLQSSAGRGRGRSTAASVAQRSHTLSTGAAGGAEAAPSAATAATTTASARQRLKPVREEAPTASRPAAGAGEAAAATAATGSEVGPKPADSSSSSSSSPKVRGEKSTVNQPSAATGSADAATAAAGSAARLSRARNAAQSPLAAGSGQTQGSGWAASHSTQQAQPSAHRNGSSSSHDSRVGHGSHQHQGGSQPASSPSAHLSTPSSTMSMLTSSSEGGAAVTSAIQDEPAAAYPAAPAGTSIGATGSQGPNLYQPVLLGVASGGRTSADTELVVAALTGGASTPSSSNSTVSKPSSLSFDVPAAGTASAQREDDSITPMLGPRSRGLTGQSAGGGISPVPMSSGLSSGSSSSVRAASLHSLGGGGSDAVGASPSSGYSLQAPGLGLESSGRVSSELRRSSSATSEELEQLLQQLSQYEEHLLEEARSLSVLPPELAPQQQQQQQAGGAASEVASLHSSVSWSQTLAALADHLPPGERDHS